MVIMEENTESDADTIYGALVISCSASPPEDLVKLILGTDVLPEHKNIHDVVAAYPWHIETKYYHADINLFTTKGKDLVNEGFAESVQAVVIYLDSKCPSKFEEVKSWQPFVEHFSADIQILVCDNCSKPTPEISLSKSFLLDWCLENNYELVELNPEEFSDDEDSEDIFKETNGCKRIVQALHAHLWPNMEMKENPSINSTARLEQILKSYDEAQLNVEESNAEPSENGAQGTEEITLGKIEDEEIFESILTDDGSSFENLFGKFKDMKEKANALQGEDRKQYAEKVAIAFWKAMGGDEDEIGGLSSEEDN